MEKSAVFIFTALLAVVSSVIAEANDSLACCPPETYILSDECYDPKRNSTESMRLQCFSTIKRANFTIVSGTLKMRLFDEHMETFDSEEACYGNHTKSRNLTKVRPMALLCITPAEEEIIIEDATLGHCMIISVLFLAATAIIYSSFSELRDLFGKSVINFCTSLAIGLGILGIMKLMMYRDMSACAARGFLAYFFLMTAFFWTNSISIQVLRDTRRPATVDYGWTELRWYMLYSWGVPTVLTTIMAIVNYHPGDHERPGIGLNHCWFFTREQQWYYMYSIMTILLLTNFAIFIYIATIVWRFSFKSTHIKAVKFKLSMTFRLIVLMGLPWIFEMLSSAIGGGRLIFALIDVFNSLQGILVFLVLVVRKRVVKVLHQRGCLDCCSGPIERWLAVGDDAETNVVQHTDVPLHDDHYTNGIRN